MQFIDQEVRLRATIIKLAEFSSVVLLDSVRPLKGVFSSITSSYVVLKMHGFGQNRPLGKRSILQMELSEFMYFTENYSSSTILCILL